MNRFRKWISCLVMLAFVVTTMPSIAHAAMPHGTATVAGSSDQSAAAPHPDCAGHEGQAQNTQKAADQNAPQGKDDCCDKTCKCLNSSCNSATKILGQNSYGISPLSMRSATFAFEEQSLDSGIVSRLKRPPRT